MLNSLSSLELCAGAGGQARGLELAGFHHDGLVEIDADCCKTLKLNRPDWTVHEQDLNEFDGQSYRGIDLLAGGLPCPPFSVAGKQLGKEDERNLFPAAIRLVDETRPKAIMIENVRGFLDAVFGDYRDFIKAELKKLGYDAHWRLLNASDYGVPQLRPRVVIIALRDEIKDAFDWPAPQPHDAPTVGETLIDLMSARGWRGAKKWAKGADEIAPTLVGGSKKHGGPDLGPTRAKKAWASLGVNGKTIAEEAPERDYVGMPRLTVRMAARIQGFDDQWQFHGRKTTAYRQVGNAFPPPVAKAVAEQLKLAIQTRSIYPVAKIA
ncbi:MULTISPECIES: DNA cytosine methyltransferase [unclassified Brucella]|uniref:DNA cytosine methyltransferase n=2 Tax=Brucella TaxID=234 RepID=UPI0012AE4FE6|nr:MULTISPECIES: DNA cytosine methyltransferase [unclassified Brucella]MRN44799.1 DNA (cytosine-5-)-methyltransferase [Brucella sp. 09RB8913]CAB4325004.1 DNA-cytosine methyltransferase [Brucella sp. 191011898]